MIEETERERKLEDAERVVRLREELLGFLGHDLRNPLNTIVVGASHLARLKDLPPAGRETVNHILEGGKRMSRMIDALLDFTESRLGKGIPVHRRSLDIEPVVREVVGEFETSNPETPVEVNVSGDTRALADAGRSAQVVSNLIGNAVQHSSPGEAVRVTLRGESDDVVMEVTNRGEPISPEAQEVMFEPFRKGSPERKRRGLGLGLYIVHQIMRSHGGSVAVRSTAAEGTTFIVRWPRRRPAAGTD